MLATAYTLLFVAALMVALCAIAQSLAEHGPHIATLRMRLFATTPERYVTWRILDASPRSFAETRTIRERREGVRARLGSELPPAESQQADMPARLAA